MIDDNSGSQATPGKAELALMMNNVTMPLHSTRDLNTMLEQACQLSQWLLRCDHATVVSQDQLMSCLIVVPQVLRREGLGSQYVLTRMSGEEVLYIYLYLLYLADRYDGLAGGSWRFVDTSCGSY